MARMDTETSLAYSVLQWIYEQDLETVEAWKKGEVTMLEIQQKYSSMVMMHQFSRAYHTAMRDYNADTHRQRLIEHLEVESLLLTKRLERLKGGKD